MYELIKTCYTLRHLLVHCSATKRVMVPHDHGGTILLDIEDTKYQELISLFITTLNIPVPAEHLTIELLMLDNNVVELFTKCNYNSFSQTL